MVSTSYENKVFTLTALLINQEYLFIEAQLNVIIY